jgi:hypothetical protein
MFQAFDASLVAISTDGGHYATSWVFPEVHSAL